MGSSRWAHAHAVALALLVLGLLAVTGAAARPHGAAGRRRPLDDSAAASCASQLAALSNGTLPDWIDPDTPAEACTVKLCRDNDSSVCDTASPPTYTYQLVFSDEFEGEGRDLSPAGNDSRWTSEDMWAAGTADWQVYKHEQVTVADGAAQLTIDHAGEANATAPSQQPDGVVWNVSRAHKSGQATSWNKFCYTGGYLEARLQLPGDHFASGLWPAFWLMGNLGRAGYMATTSGLWPYSYNTCGNDTVGAGVEGGPTPQNITACPDPPGFDRTKWGLLPGQGRGAPEIDVLEVKVDSSIGHSYGDPQGGGKDQQHEPFSSMTLQSAPLLPNGTTWTSPPEKEGDEDTAGPGQVITKPVKDADGKERLWRHITYWRGIFGATELDRPGNLYEDSVSAYAVLDPSFWTEYHTFGLDWVPGQYARWYIDGHFLYEVNKEALRAQTNAAGETTGERLVPVEPMYILLNLAMAESFSKVDLDRLAFPATYKVDYVRLYQSPDAFNLGCSPPEFPTEQYIACNREKYVLHEGGQALVPAACRAAPACRQEWGWDYAGGDLPAPDGAQLTVPLGERGSASDCCAACQGTDGCGAYTFFPGSDASPDRACYLKAATGWTRVPSDAGILSGTVSRPAPCAFYAGVDYTGGDLLSDDGFHNTTAPADSADHCCAICRRVAGCGAFTYAEGELGLKGLCYMKQPSGWAEGPKGGVVSGTFSAPAAA